MRQEVEVAVRLQLVLPDRTASLADGALRALLSTLLHNLKRLRHGTLLHRVGTLDTYKSKTYEHHDAPTELKEHFSSYEKSPLVGPIPRCFASISLTARKPPLGGHHHRHHHD